MSADAFQKAVASTKSVLANVSPDQLDQSTPCASWQVRELVNHIVGGANWFADTVETGISPPLGNEADIAGGDINAEFEKAASRALAAFNAPGAMEKMLKLPDLGMEVPGAMMEIGAAQDTFIHGWDLAKATGQSTDLDPALAAQLLEASRVMVADAMRGDEGVAAYGAIIEVPASAPMADQLAGFLGRQP